METKWWLNSATVRGVIGMAAAILALLGIVVSEEDQTAISAGVIALGGIMSGVVALIGRFKANKRISFKK